MTRVFCVSGNVCAGKSTVSKLLEQYDGVHRIEIGDVARENWNMSGSSLTLSEYARRMKEVHGMEWPVNEISRDVSTRVTDGLDVVIAGIRSPVEVSFLRRRVNAEIVTIAVWATYQTRRERYLNRGREDDGDEAEFRTRNRREAEWGIEEVREEADVVIVNEFTPDVLRNDVNEVYYADDPATVQITTAQNPLTEEYLV